MRTCCICKDFVTFVVNGCYSSKLAIYFGVKRDTLGDFQMIGIVGHQCVCVSVCV